MAKLKPCPFCGKKPFHYYFTDGFHSYSRVSCKECNASMTKKHIIGTEAIEAWNRRHVWGKTKMPRLKIIEIHPEYRANVEENNGHCPCAIWQTEDTKCMCKDFREQTEPGECHCGRFEKVVEDDG